MINRRTLLKWFGLAAASGAASKVLARPNHLTLDDIDRMHAHMKQNNIPGDYVRVLGFGSKDVAQGSLWVNSETGDIYRCVGVHDSVNGWKSLS